MAWQLIYTSAPRLLEAGRTGFGTVARHRAVSGLLATTVERFSQFARLPGHDPRRVVHAHRMVTVGNVQYHVLSCVRDAGSDYTGRTNHIAHHLVAEAREVRPLMAAGVTPADILVAMAWRGAWTEGPHYLDPADEIDLGSLAAQPCSVWGQITGSSENARLLSPASMRRGCYVIIPPGVDARKLFGESLHEMKAQAWQVTFTTSLEPSDEVADFRWIGLAPGSPLRAQAEASSRDFFDLLDPASLPEPPPPAAREKVEKDELSAVPPATEKLLREQISSTPQSQTQRSPRPVQMGRDKITFDTQTQELQPKTRKPFPLLKLMVAAALLVGAGGAFMHQIDVRQQSQGQKRLEGRIDELWQTHHLKLDESQNWLRQALVNDADAEELIASHEECLKQIRRSLAKPQSAQAVAAPDRMRDDFSDLLNTHAEWLKKRALVRLPADLKIQTPSDVRAIADRWTDEKLAWRQFAGHFTQEPIVDRSELEQLVKSMLVVMNADERPQGSPDEWRQLFDRLDEKQAPSWLECWSQVESLGNRTPSPGLQATMVQLAKQPGTPTWLKSLLRDSRRPAEAASAKAGQNQTMTSPETVLRAIPAAGSADALDATHPIFVFAIREGVVWEAALANLPELPVETGMTLRMGGVVARGGDLGEDWKMLGNAYRPSLSASDKILFEGGRLSHLPERKEGCRLIARSSTDGHVLFDLRIITPFSKAQPLIAFDKTPELALVAAEDQLRIDGIVPVIRRLRLVDAPTPQFQLRYESKEDAAAAPLVYSLQMNGDHASVSSAALSGGAMVEFRRLQTSAMELNEGIKKDREFARSLNLKMADRAQRLADLTASIADKETKLADVAARMETLRKQSPTVLPPTGPCMLMEMTGMVRGICRINLTRSQP